MVQIDNKLAASTTLGDYELTAYLTVYRHVMVRW